MHEFYVVWTRREGRVWRSTWLDLLSSWTPIRCGELVWVREAGVFRRGGLTTVHAPDLPHSVSLSWQETCAHLRTHTSDGPWQIHATGRWYEQHDEAGALVCALRPPFVLLTSKALPPVEILVDRVPGRHAILLFQAGAASLGLFDDDELLDHKAMKRYVVRGKGRAQPTHLKTRGKSRMGSRLRLRNAQMLLEQVSERLRTWWAKDPPPARLYLSCPVRLFADLCRTEPPPPVTPDDPRCLRIPIDVHVPKHAELLRVHRSISRGRLWSRDRVD